MPRFLCLLLAILFLSQRINSLPLSTTGRWIVDSVSGERVKLHCVNWAAHMAPVIAEGLDRRPIAGIATSVAALGFNCVRLTWATSLFTSPRYENLTVAASLASLGLADAVEGVRTNNPSMMEMTVQEAFDAAVHAVGEAGLMLVLDNHVSQPRWCCKDDDGNGFFGDSYFDTDEWLRGLELVARRFRGYPQVVGMSLRNELRGPRQSEPIWYQNMAHGAQRVHQANPNLVIILSGLNYDTDLSFLKGKPLLKAPLDGKLVLEAHWYSFSLGQREEWADRSTTRVCSDAAQRFEEKAGFLVREESRALPLFLSEFGVDQTGKNRADNHFLSCFLGYVAQRDLDWALWALQGSYYLRNGRPGFQEPYGVLDSDWRQPKNARFKERFQLIQEMIQDPRSSATTYQIIYHPQSGHCLSKDEDNNAMLSSCQNRSRWNYGGDGSTIQLVGTAYCLKVAGEGLPALLSTECDDDHSGWRMASSSGFQLASMDAQGRQLCLERNSSDSAVVLTRECLCLDGSDCVHNPQHQWFRVLSSNIA